MTRSTSQHIARGAPHFSSSSSTTPSSGTGVPPVSTPSISSLSSSSTSSSSSAPRRFPAFTLLEVTVAIIILGVGVLGLAAVFAGAARQQANAARLGDATELAARVEGLVRSRFGPVEQDPLAGVTPFPNYYGAENHHQPPLPTVWYPIPAHTDDNNRLKHALTIDTDAAILNPNNFLSNRFFVLDGPREFVLYENPLNAQTGRPTHGYMNDNDLGDPDSNGLFYDATQATVQGHDAFYPTGGPSRIRDLPFGRIHPGSLRVRFDIARLVHIGNNPEPARIDRRRSIYFSDAAAYTDENNENYPFGVNDLNASNPPPLRASDGALQVLFNRVLTTPGTNDPPGAYLAAFRVAQPNTENTVLGPNEWIERIVVESFQHRTDTLLSLDDRLIYRPDGSAMGASLLYQRTLDGKWRIAAFYYDAQPAATRDDPQPFIPPESADAPGNQRLLLFVQGVTLAFDEDRGAHYLQIASIADIDAVRPGQLVLVDGNRATNAATNPYTLAFRPGADDFVRVTRIERRSGNNVRAYLDAQPRHNGRAFIDPLDGQNATKVVNFWLLRPQVRSESDGRQWTIHPVMGRVIEVR